MRRLLVLPLITAVLSCGAKPPSGKIPDDPPDIPLSGAWIESATREKLWQCFSSKGDPNDSGCGRTQIECRKVLAIRRGASASFEESADGCTAILEPSCFSFEDDRYEYPRCYASAVACAWARRYFPEELIAKHKFRDFTECKILAAERDSLW